MSILYDPTAVLRKIAPKKKIKKLIKSDLTVNRAALSFVDDLDFVSKTAVADVALKVVANYKKRVDDEQDKASDLKKDPALLIQRVENALVTQIAEEIKDKYDGEFFIWLPSDADEPDPEHQLNYGKTFMVGLDEMPGDRYGCRCGMEILVKESVLAL